MKYCSKLSDYVRNFLTRIYEKLCSNDLQSICSNLNQFFKDYVNMVNQYLSCGEPSDIDCLVFYMTRLVIVCKVFDEDLRSELCSELSSELS